MRKLAQFKELGKLIVYDKEKFSGWGGVYIIVDRKNKKVYVGSAFKFTEAYRRHFTEYVSRDYQKMYIFDKGHLWDKEKLTLSRSTTYRNNRNTMFVFLKVVS